jgi:short-subunit dehydrogenase
VQTLQGRCALIAGGSGALGCEVADALGRQGVRIVLTALHPDRLEHARRLLAERGIEVAYIAGDICDAAARRMIVEQTIRWLGGIDVFVNSVGVQSLEAFDTQPIATIEESLQVNLVAPMLLTQQVLTPMLAAGHGHIVHLASLAGLLPFAHQEVYGASKAGLISFTTALRASYRSRGVSGSVICPSITGAGLSARLLARATAGEPRRLVAPRHVAQAVIRAIRYDVPEVRVSATPVLPLLLAAALSPRLGESAIERLGLNAFFRSIVEHSGGSANAPSPSPVGSLVSKT